MESCIVCWGFDTAELRAAGTNRRLRSPPPWRGLGYLQGLGLQLVVGSPVSVLNRRTTSSCSPTSLSASPAKQCVGGGLHSPTSRKLKVLALHGHAQSASKFK